MTKWKAAWTRIEISRFFAKYSFGDNMCRLIFTPKPKMFGLGCDVSAPQDPSHTCILISKLRPRLRDRWNMWSFDGSQALYRVSSVIGIWVAYTRCMYHSINFNNKLTSDFRSLSSRSRSLKFLANYIKKSNLADVNIFHELPSLKGCTASVLGSVNVKHDRWRLHIDYGWKKQTWQNVNILYSFLLHVAMQMQGYGKLVNMGTRKQTKMNIDGKE